MRAFYITLDRDSIKIHCSLYFSKISRGYISIPKENVDDMRQTELEKIDVKNLPKKMTLIATSSETKTTNRKNTKIII